MRRTCTAALLSTLLALGSLGCGSNAVQPGATPARCEVALAGPLIGLSYDPAPQPPATGGPLADGDYELVRMVVYNQAFGPWSNEENQPIRMAMRFTTSERSSNHAEGRMTVHFEIAPAAQCQSGAFATVQTQLRGIDAKGKLSAVPYSVLPGYIVLHVNERVAWHFRKRA